MKITRENFNIKNLIITALIIAVAVLGYIAFQNKSSNNNKVLAKISGDVITEADLINKVKALTNNKEVDLSKIDAEVKQAVIKEIAAEKLLIKEAKKSNVAGKKEVKEQIERATNEILKIALISQMYEKQITEEAIKKRYEELSKDLQGKTEYKVSHILVASKEEAESLKATISNNKAIFTKIATTQSKDQASAKNGGSLGYVVNGQLDPNFEKGFVDLQKGVVSEPVKTKLGWHLILVEDKRPAKAAAFEDVKNALKQDLANKILKDHVNKLLEEGKFKFVSNKS